MDNLSRFLIRFFSLTKGFEAYFEAIEPGEPTTLTWGKGSERLQVDKNELLVLRTGFYLARIIRAVLSMHMLIVLAFTPFLDQIHRTGVALLPNFGYLIAVPVFLFWATLLMTAIELPKLFLSVALGYLQNNSEMPDTSSGP